MKVAIMQPYFMPYIGYFQLIAAVDQFVVYDNIKYTKKGWINRNRMLKNGRDVVFSIPLKNASDQLEIRDRELAGEFNRESFLNQIRESYKNAPYYQQTMPLIQQIVLCPEQNLFAFLHHSLHKTCSHLGISTPIKISSQIGIDHRLKGKDRVISLCNALGADTYINPIGGLELYSRENFLGAGLDLKFIQSQPFTYAQFDGDFLPWLSILDVLMFSPLKTIQTCLVSNYALV